MTKKGFTLVELLVSVAIIVTLTALGLTAMQGARSSARDSRRKSDLEEIRSALEMYRTDEGVYPDTVALEAELETDYLAKLPTDPAGNCAYAYARLTVSTYTLCATLENPEPGADTSGCGSCGASCTCNYRLLNP